MRTLGKLEHHDSITTSISNKADEGMSQYEDCQLCDAQAPLERYMATTIHAWLLVARRQLHRADLLEALTISCALAGFQSNTNLDPEHTGPESSPLGFTQVFGKLVTDVPAIAASFNDDETSNEVFSASSKVYPMTKILKAHEEVATTCLCLLHTEKIELASLSAVDFATSNDKGRRPLSSLLRYSLDNWIVHYRMAESYSRTLAGRLQNILATNLYGACETANVPRHQQAVAVNDLLLRICARHGFIELIKLCLEMGFNPSMSPFGRCESPLALALANDHMDVAELLLQAGATPSSEHSKADGLVQYHISRKSPKDTRWTSNGHVERLYLTNKTTLQLVLRFAS